MRRWVPRLLFTLTFAGLTLAAGQTPKADRPGSPAVTRNGERVTLYPDGTWKYDEVPDAKLVHIRPASATEEIKLDGTRASLWYDPARWKMHKDGETQRFFLQVADGPFSMAVVVPETPTVEMQQLRGLVLENAERMLQSAQVVMDETRIINGVTVGCVRVEGISDQFPAAKASIALTVYGCYYSGTAGTIQIMTYTPREIFPGLRIDLTALLDGLAIQEAANAHPE